MGATSTIEWTDASWNPVTGCTPVSPGCQNCYAKRFHERFPKRGPFNKIVCHQDRLDIPLRWRKPRMVFVCSMGDLFHPDVPIEFIDKVFAAMALCPQHTFQVLTKRPERMAEYRSQIRAELVFANMKAMEDITKPVSFEHVWLGTTVEDPIQAHDRIPELLRCPAAVRFISAEPLLGSLNLREWLHRLDWVIVGGESGLDRRPCKQPWIRDLVDQCRQRRVPVFIKQIHDKRGRLVRDIEKFPEDLRVREYPRVSNARR